MGLFDRVRDIFGKKTPGPYEAAQRERVDAVRRAVPEDAPTLESVRAVVALITAAEEEDVKGDSRILEDLGFGDLEMMELELICEDLFGVQLASDDLNLADTLEDLARIIDRKKGG